MNRAACQPDRTGNGAGNALVLFSGGQDSATCLAWALERFDRVETLGFDYGQRHSVELCARQRLLDAFHEKYARLGPDHMLATDIFSAIGGSALLDGGEIGIRPDGLPDSFVPGRNLFFLVCAAALAYRRKCRHLVAGLCETDFSGYPDCRDTAVKSANVAINLCMDADFVLDTPLMWLSKAQTWQLAERLGGEWLVELIRRESHSCYMGERRQLHDWGFGCGHCPACRLRAAGWREYRSKKA